MPALTFTHQIRISSMAIEIKVLGICFYFLQSGVSFCQWNKDAGEKIKELFGPFVICLHNEYVRFYSLL